jgi:hypothetical protein
MNNLEATVAVLAAHREARQWTDEAVAADLVAQLGLKPDGEAKNAKPVVPPGITEAEVVAHETAAKEATAKAKAAREALDAQTTEAKKADPANSLAQTGAPTPVELKRQADARRLNLPETATQAQIDAAEAQRRAPPAPTPALPRVEPAQPLA